MGDTTIKPTGRIDKPKTERLIHPDNLEIITSLSTTTIPSEADFPNLFRAVFHDHSLFPTYNMMPPRAPTKKKSEPQNPHPPKPTGTQRNSQTQQEKEETQTHPSIHHQTPSHHPKPPCQIPPRTMPLLTPQLERATSQNTLPQAQVKTPPPGSSSQHHGNIHTPL
jgi:hypothetical protein